MHDDYILGYVVNLLKKDIVIKIGELQQINQKVVFYDVLTHCFENITDYNIVFDICEHDISSFFMENKEKINVGKNYCWPTYYETNEELLLYLKNNGYKYIKIESSIGMCGWVLAKSYEIENIS